MQLFTFEKNATFCDSSTAEAAITLSRDTRE